MTDALAKVAPGRAELETARDALSTMEDTAAHLAPIVDVMELTTREAEEQGAELARSLARVIRTGEDARKALVKPFKAQLSEVDKAFRGPRRALERLKRQIEHRLAEAVQERARVVREAQEAAARAAAAKDYAEASTQAAKVQAVPERPPEGISVRWDHVPVEFDLEALPKGYLMVDLAKIKAEIRTQVAEGLDPSIPGVTIEKRPRAITRRN